MRLLIYFYCSPQMLVSPTLKYILNHFRLKPLDLALNIAKNRTHNWVLGFLNYEVSSFLSEFEAIRIKLIPHVKFVLNCFVSIPPLRGEFDLGYQNTRRLWLAKKTNATSHSCLETLDALAYTRKSVTELAPTATAQINKNINSPGNSGIQQNSFNVIWLISLETPAHSPLKPS